MRHGRQVRRVGLDEDTVVGHKLKQCVIRPLLECDDAAERDVPARVHGCLRKRMRPGETMQHTRNSGGARFGHHRARVVLGIARVDDDWAGQLAGKRKLRGERPPLLETGRVVVMIIEPALADRDGAARDHLAQGFNVAGGIEGGSVVGMYTRRMRNKVGIPRRQGGGVAGGGKRVALTASGPDANYRAGPGDAGPVDYLVAVAGERRVGEVRVAVDEVWNAVVLRGHLRSIQRSTGLAM